MTWNLWWRFGDRWRDRQPGIRSVIEFTAPDIVGLQEVWGNGRSSQADEIGRALGLHAAFAAPSLPPAPDPPEHPDQAGVEVGIGLLSRWPIREMRHLQLPSANRSEAIALTAVIDHPEGPLPVVVACLDWEPEASPTRMEQARLLAEPVPAILMGDLNVPPEAPEIRAISACMTDAWAVVNGPDDPGHTLSSRNRLASRDAWQIDRRIDYVFVRREGADPRFVVEDAFIAGDADGELPPSDHYAVVADLRTG